MLLYGAYARGPISSAHSCVAAYVGRPYSKIAKATLVRLVLREPRKWITQVLLNVRERHDICCSIHGVTAATRYVADIMTPDPVVTSPTVTAWTADQLAEKRGVHHLAVVDGDRLVGVVCRCDLHRAGVAATIGSCMHRDPATVDEQETVEVAADRMIAMQVGCLPVVDPSGTLRGVVTRHALCRIGSIHAKAFRR